MKTETYITLSVVALMLATPTHADQWDDMQRQQEKERARQQENTDRWKAERERQERDRERQQTENDRLRRQEDTKQRDKKW